MPPRVSQSLIQRRLTIFIRHLVLIVFQPLLGLFEIVEILAIFLGLFEIVEQEIVRHLFGLLFARIHLAGRFSRAIDLHIGNLDPVHHEPPGEKIGDTQIPDQRLGRDEIIRGIFRVGHLQPLDPQRAIRQREVRLLDIDLRPDRLPHRVLKRLAQHRPGEHVLADGNETHQ